MKNLNSKVHFSISDTPLPHNFIAEKIILSCLLINSKQIYIRYCKLQKGKNPLF